MKHQKRDLLSLRGATQQDTPAEQSSSDFFDRLGEHVTPEEHERLREDMAKAEARSWLSPETMQHIRGF